MKVYLIEAGQYSDIHVVGVATTKENAEAIKKTHDRVEPYYHAYITEYETDTYIPLVEGKSVFHAKLLANDGIVTVQQDAFPTCVDSQYINLVRECVFSENLIVDVIAIDKEHAAKIAQDLFAEYKAKKEGVAL